MYDTATDGELISRASKNDRGAFSALFARHGKAVYLYAWGSTRDDRDAEDLTQEVFVVAWRRLREIRVVEASALPWLLVTTRNLLLNHHRRARPTVQLNEELAASVDHHEELRWVMAEVDKLGGTDRRIVQLCLIDGYGYSEAATYRGLTTSALAKRVERVRAALRSTVRGES